MASAKKTFTRTSVEINDRLYAFKFKHFRNIHRKVTFGTPLQSFFWNTCITSEP
jgi:hypothetical protein